MMEGGRATNSWIFAQLCLTELPGLYQFVLQLSEVAPGSEKLLEGIRYEAGAGCWPPAPYCGIWFR